MRVGSFTSTVEVRHDHSCHWAIPSRIWRGACPGVENGKGKILQAIRIFYLEIALHLMQVSFSQVSQSYTSDLFS